MDVALGGSDLGEVPTEVHGARLVRVAIGPGHATVHGEVDLERAGPIPEASKGASHFARQPITEDVGDRTRRQVEHRHIGLPH